MKYYRKSREISDSEQTFCSTMNHEKSKTEHIILGLPQISAQEKCM